MTASGIYQMIARRGRQCDVDLYPHRFRHHFSRTWLDHGGPEGDLMELNGWASPQMLRRYGASARSARAPPHLRPNYERHPGTRAVTRQRYLAAEDRVPTSLMSARRSPLLLLWAIDLSVGCLSKGRQGKLSASVPAESFVRQLW